MTILDKRIFSGCGDRSASCVFKECNRITWSWNKYCGISVIRGGLCSWIVKSLLVLENVNSLAAVQCKIINYYVKLWSWLNFVTKSNPRNPRTLIPNERWWLPVLATNWNRLIFHEHQFETLNVKIQQKNFCGPNHLLFSANINQQREIHLEFCKNKIGKLSIFLCSTLNNCKTAKYLIYMHVLRINASCGKTIIWDLNSVNREKRYRNKNNYGISQIKLVLSEQWAGCQYGVWSLLTAWICRQSLEESFVWFKDSPQSVTVIACMVDIHTQCPSTNPSVPPIQKAPEFAKKQWMIYSWLDDEQAELP